MNRNSRRRSLTLALASLALPLSSQALAQNFGPWSDPQPVVAVNAPGSFEGCPMESKDGLNLYFASDRAGGSGRLDILRSHRHSVGASWGLPENLGPVVNSSESDFCPTPLQGKWLLFVSSKDTDGEPGNEDCLAGGPSAAGDIFLTREHPVHGWQPPLHLGCHPAGPNTARAEFSPSLVHTDEGTVLFFSSNGYPDSQSQDIYVSQVLADGTVLSGTRVAELSTAFDDRMPNVRKDGLEIVFSSNRPGGAGQQDIYIATRGSTQAPWGAPQRIANPEINTAAAEIRASLSGDGTRLHFGRPGTGDVYVSTRAKAKGKGHD